MTDEHGTGDPVPGDPATARPKVVTGDRTMVTHLWPLLVAAALGLVPFTVMSTFLVPIAQGAGASVEVVGGMRGLGGVAALAVGALAAPLVDRLPADGPQRWPWPSWPSAASWQP